MLTHLSAASSNYFFSPVVIQALHDIHHEVAGGDGCGVAVQRDLNDCRWGGSPTHVVEEQLRPCHTDAEAVCRRHDHCVSASDPPRRVPRCGQWRELQPLCTSDLLRAALIGPNTVNIQFSGVSSTHKGHTRWNMMSTSASQPADDVHRSLNLSDRTDAQNDPLSMTLQCTESGRPILTNTRQQASCDVSGTPWQGHR